ncbi:3-oxoacyl-[acyl-carrier-protein] reductase FabG [Clostridium acetireducens DSM 10703]|jgi:3-oxoacyl-[acyl-carrier protein] reductase|uniref:3-oxoacyl-[acyl-carrier-protein] reductase n=1 Tax=Clostridium acetireducens DSM 10703 TaxID=1121290 RepID=A0A1E8EZR3_9CLOT|nr:3-oxoacyl-[acyl-carrier-protein] reductase [Clostridium acetireducens]OFI06620.1 3-oxoacyl-[acyl-carrier-protein] reductase FabG [Clostridium acetireducens DSM 10703]
MENDCKHTLKGCTAIVTGASRGIGKSIALKLASLGANLVLNYRSSSKEIELVVQKAIEMKVEAIAVQGDVSDFQQSKNIIQKAKDIFGSIDILVNNAGVTKDNLILRMKEEDFDKVININLKGAFNCIKHVAPIMLKQRKGKIINIASVVGIVGNAGQVNYAASKAGVIAMTKSIAKELGSKGINVNAIAPGFVETDMTEVLSDKVKESTLNNIPLKRFGMPEDIAEVVAFLASSSSNYVTGQVINVDGGMVM